MIDASWRDMPPCFREQRGRHKRWRAIYYIKKRVRGRPKYLIIKKRTKQQQNGVSSAPVRVRWEENEWLTPMRGTGLWACVVVQQRGAGPRAAERTKLQIIDWRSRRTILRVWTKVCVGFYITSLLLPTMLPLLRGEENGGARACGRWRRTGALWVLTWTNAIQQKQLWRNTTELKINIFITLLDKYVKNEEQEIRGRIRNIFITNVQRVGLNVYYVWYANNMH